MSFWKILGDIILFKWLFGSDQSVCPTDTSRKNSHRSNPLYPTFDDEEERADRYDSAYYNNRTSSYHHSYDDDIDDDIMSMEHDDFDYDMHMYDDDEF